LALFDQAVFSRAAHRLGDLPPPDRPEVAFAGRSNAGKSSAINALTRRRRLAFTSKTPGRTREIVFFELPFGYLVDLPGYGYARVPDAVREHWESTLGEYLRGRGALCGLVLIMDARHPLTELDDRMLAWFGPTGKPVHVLLTKADKLSRGAAAGTLARVRRALARTWPQCTVQLFSSSSGLGVEEAEAVCARWFGVELPQAIPAAPEGGPGGGAARARIKRPQAKGEKLGAKMP
jgi:GTP-binding protein